MRVSQVFRAVLLALLMLVATPLVAAPQPVRPSMADSFRLGVGGDTLCQVQTAAADPAASGLFDRAYAIVCRDATAPIGKLYALRVDSDDPVARLAARRDPAFRCGDGISATLADAGSVTTLRCTSAAGLGYDVLIARRGKTLYAAEGLAGYRSALELGLRTLIVDRAIAGPISIATTEAGDPASFARAQAGNLDPDRARAEGYRRNNAGSYADASEFFDTLLQRTAQSDNRHLGEFLANRALQKSDLGDFDQADALFDQMDKLPTSDRVELRLRRNYRAIHLLNQNRLDAAMAVLDAPIDPIGETMPATSEIDVDTAIALDDGVPLARQLGITQNVSLTPFEKAVLLDDQAIALRGTILRMRGDAATASDDFKAVLVSLQQIRGGRVTSVARLRAQVMTDQAALAEGAGDKTEAEKLLEGAIAILGAEYPDSIAHDVAEARLAAFLARQGRGDEALPIYRTVAADLSMAGGATGGFAGLLDPYFALLIEKAPSRPALYDDLFLASQVLLRPGVADTQATLARQLSGGSGESGRLFRQSLNEARQVEALRVELARLAAIDGPTAQDRAGIAVDRAQIDALGAEQSATQAKLAAFPAYRAIATQALTLAALRAALHPGEAYWKLTVVGHSIYGLYVTPGDTKAWKLKITPAELAGRVDAIRDTIAVIEDGRTVTFPFDVTAARALYVDLAGPVAVDLPHVHHLIFEPDGAMLKLPVSLLVTEQAGADRYIKRIKDPKADPFDMTGIAWLGASTDVSTALSVRAFRDVRATAPSTAPRTYLGFGHNAPVPAFMQLTSLSAPTGSIDCRWPLTSWSHPIAADELVRAQQAIGARQAVIETGTSFTDSDIVGRSDLSSYRILHFATHGLVTAPRPQCPAQPALLTSFGTAGSDGLLSFSEIYGLQLDADLVVLSACDTAGTADVAVTRAAGVTTGGGNALDGLVRAFIGAGGRSVLASHWPAPDDYHATEQLIGGLFSAPRGTSVAEALRLAQRKLMAIPATSHPYYWAGFALIGDGAQPVLRDR
jgi:CHAT domain-containing protein/tetratricopeptide (TPR) repeat protein